MATKKLGEKGLNPKQIKFCEFYVSEEFFCNGTKSYLMAYGGKTSYVTAQVEASKFLTNPNILNYIDKLLVDMGLNDQRVDKELAKMIIQDVDWSVKMKAISEYNKLKQRITDKLTINAKVEQSLSDEDQKMYDKILKHQKLND